ncbi:MAG TPA: [protein-PII] uridylyltransferase [Polyangiaceae bacterium]|jgi:[protein-PII] uridylyltransferase|nr:[protein-PII] uridylyltransferase [Polyangiaceae bacterium]
MTIPSRLSSRPAPGGPTAERPFAPPSARAFPALDAPALRDAIERHRASLAAKLTGNSKGEDGLALGRLNARFLDACIAGRFAAATAKSDHPASVASGLALAAVGSFGRGAVALHSDADLVVIVGSASPEAVGTFVEALLYPLWDAKLPVGHQILSAADGVALAQKDLATATALLDLRCIAGDAALLAELVARANEGVFGEEELAGFIDRLEQEAAARHERFGGSVYLLEPDVKSGAGGLRDLDGARWAARARYRVGGDADDDSALGVWGELVRVGVLVSREAHEIAASEEFLWRVRNRLHARAGRKSDRLGFEDQEVIGAAMGYGSHRAQAAERLMQDYYLHARAIIRARASLLERLRPVRRRGKATLPVDLGGGVLLFDGQITISDSGALQQEPALAMRVFAACVRQNAPVLPFARDAITRLTADAEWCERLRASAEAAALFIELVCTVPETRTARGSMVGELHDVGLLLAMVPEFLPVTGRVHHDVYHVYTVDVHSVAAVDRLRQLARGELAHEMPLASRLAVEIAQAAPLFLATLLHDVGKGWPDATGSLRQHSKVGADMCRTILPRLGLGAEDSDEACQLVLDHLLMYRIATRRDLDDIDTIAEFCRSVRGHEGLRNLYLLTVSDLSTTSPTAMTSWKARMLDELYFAAEAHLAGQQPKADAERVARVREAVRAGWKGSPAELEAVLTSMPERYLLANGADSIIQHARVVLERGGRAAHVGRVHSRHPEVAELCVVADDRPGLLASIAAAITANRLEVLAAQVYSRPIGDHVEAVDVFWVRDRDGGTEGVAVALARLGRDLEDVCSGRIDAAELLKQRMGSGSPWRERPSPAVPTEILLDDRASPRHTIVEVFAKDRPGLLYRLSRALHGLALSIALSKINTEGTRVADVFYVNELDGKKVARGPRYAEIHDALVSAVDG